MSLCFDKWENPDASNSKLVDGNNTNLEEISNPVLANNESYIVSLLTCMMALALQCPI